MIIIKTPAEVAKMRKAGRVVAQAFEIPERKTARTLILIELKSSLKSEAVPSLRLHGFPAGICAPQRSGRPWHTWS